MQAALHNVFISASFCILLVILLSEAAWGQKYTISTYAGNAVTGAGFSGDGGPASAALLAGPSGVAVNAAGILYIVDTENERIRIVQNGTITTVVGNGGFGYAGDGGSPLGAQLNNPTNVAFDSAGDLYIADTDNSVIRMVSDGAINTVAGLVCPEGQTTFCGPGYLGDGGQATIAQLDVPLGVALDSTGNLYISDTGNNVLREVTPGGIITTIATNLRLQHPAGLAVDGAGNLYIADTNNNRIMKLAPNGAIAVVAGNNVAGYSGDGGAATKAELSFPTGVATDGAGNIYIADKTNSRIRKVTAEGIISTIAGVGEAVFYGDGGPAADAGLSFPSSVAVDQAGNVYVADTGNNVVRLLQIPAPAVTASGIVNAASFTATTSPGALASIFGTNFGAVIASASSVPFPKTLGVVSVTVGGRPAPVFYISPTQINFQIPWETPVGNADVIVTVNGVASDAGTVTVKTTAPGLFTQGDGAAIVQNSDYSLNTSSNPAAAGSAIIAYLTGSGPVNQSVADGAISPSAPLAQVTSQASATIGTQTAQVLFAGLTPGLVGVLQVNVMVPAGMTTGSYPLTITVGGQASNAAPISVTQ